MKKDGRTTHGLRYTRANKLWRAMRQRCCNPKLEGYKHYGGRGIKVCGRWDKFENFYADMGNPPEGYTIERIDCNGPYAPENCKWATTKEQACNKRNTKLVTFNGVTKRLFEWSEEVNISARILYQRLFVYKWPIEEALFVKKYRRSTKGDALWHSRFK